ncbi:FAD-dependent oxidoreductase [Gracilimonas sp. BCB1]|uniref:FAD-dependent oxidoreductase n=1 Tax=Gracilimonas sp. BCB1 TaxID=3152362 RepID=UPI0032D99821
MKNNTHITVLGAGVSGLTTGIILAEHGYTVTILTKELPEQTTSAVAAAIWFPYEAYPANKVNEWSRTSFLTYRELAKSEASGVSFIPFTAYLDTEQKPWWLYALPGEFILDKNVQHPVHPNYRGYTLNVPLIETPIYLTYLLNRFKKSGGKIIQREISSITELEAYFPVVNCTGLGAKHLFNDEQLYPIQGQVVRVAPDQEIQGMATEYELGDQEMAYIIPRRDGIILGGSAKKHEWSTEADPALTQRILTYCSEFEPTVLELPVLDVKVGLRPGRPQIRLEKDPHLPVVHNYGHGGAGFTVSWGCAEEVIQLL